MFVDRAGGGFVGNRERGRVAPNVLSTTYCNTTIKEPAEFPPKSNELLETGRIYLTCPAAPSITAAVTTTAPPKRLLR